MLQKLFFAVLCLTISAQLFGQFSLDVLGGINIASQTIENFETADPTANTYFFAGVSAGYLCKSKVRFFSDLLYSQKGFKDGDKIEYSPSSYRFNYIDVLPQIEYRVHRNIGVFVGVDFGINISEEQKVSGANDFVKFEGDVVKSFDFGLIGGIRAQLGALSLFARYNPGLTNVNNQTFTDQNGFDFNTVKIRNMNLQFGLQYALFKCGKT